MDENIYERIKRLRIKSHMSQYDLAQKTGYADKSMISKIESGKVDISGKTIMKFAKALNTTSRYLMDGDDNNDDIYHVYLSKEELHLVSVYRSAESVVKIIALEMLEKHPAREKEKVAK